MRPRRWTSKVSCASPLLLLCAAAVLALAVVLLAEGRQKSLAAAAKKQEQDRQLLVELLKEDQIGVREYIWNNQRVQSYQPLGNKQRGIVICAGGNKLLINVYVSLKVLRNTLNCNLPIEIYHNGQRDVGPVTRAAFTAFQDVRFIDLTTLGLPANHRKPKLYNGYVQKILSLYSTRFQEVLLLDADSQPLKDPVELFESDAFKQYGNIVWPDFWREGNSESPHSEVYQWLGLMPPWLSAKGWQCAESGQVFIDKTRHWDVLEWLWYLNSHAELLYQHMLGDKDTFEMAFMLAGKHTDFHRVRISPGVPLTRLYTDVYRGGWRDRFIHREESSRYFRVGMLQYDDNGVPAFMHRTERTKFANWVNGYSLDMMRPKLVIPSFGPDIPAEAKAAAWNLHSIPKSMASENCSCCALTPGSLAVITSASGMYPASKNPFSQSRGSSLVGRGVEGVDSNSSQAQGCVWSGKGATLSKQPLFPVSYFGQPLSNPLHAGFEAYTDLETIFGPKIRWTASP